MSDFPQGPGWWEASDGKWYAPELHPDRRPPPPQPPPPELPPFPPPGAGPEPQFEPPRPDQRVPDPSYPPPGAGYPPPAYGAPEYAGGPFYPPVPTTPTRSTGKILAFIFGGIFLLLAAGCGVFIWAFREEIAEATIDFSDADVVDDPASCEVTGVDFADDYEVEATLTASSALVSSHYRLDYRLVESDGTVAGVDYTVFRNMGSGETRTEDAFNTIDADEPIHLVSCEILTVRRVDA